VLENVKTAAEQLASQLAEGSSFEAALVSLRERGASPVDAIKAIREARGVSLGEAKRLLFESKAWQLENEAADRLHEQVLAALRKEQDSE
jgi:ribosomal protein L7/L12